MKFRMPQIITILILAIVITMACPASFAKYTYTNTYAITLSKNVEIKEFSKIYTTTDISGTNIPYSGWYAVVAKGGDGGRGIAITGSTVKGYVDGGSGGLIATYVYLTKDSKLYAYVGTSGGDASKNSKGSSGSVASIGTGGLGDNGTDLGIGSKIFSSSAASGGGGAASSVFINSATDYSKLLCIAGGGGAGGGYDVGYVFPGGGYLGALKTYPAGMGGSGGSNVLGTKTSALSVSGGSVYAGNDGTDGSVMSSEGDSAGNYKNTYVTKRESGYHSYGLGGTTVGGYGGHTTAQDLCKEFDGTSKKAGASYAASTSGGVGGAGYIYGGAGGGGYAGGGGGVGTSLYYSAGGGGGGSSYVASKTPGGTNSTSSMNLAQLTSLLSESGYTIKNSSIAITIMNSFSYSRLKYTYDTTSGGNYNCFNVNNSSGINKGGFVIVKYIGTKLP